MKESKNNASTMYQSIPAVAALNHVPGFEPAKLLRRTKSRKSEEIVLKLALPYKKLWFRLANPKGRIRLNALQITEQIAIYEAQVYLDRSDTEPISSFTASCTRETSMQEDYVRVAQEEAMDEALSMAGFGLQFADVGMTKEAETYGSEIPISFVQKESFQTAIHQSRPELSMKQPVKQVAAAPPQQTRISAMPQQTKVTQSVIQQTRVSVAQPSGAQPAPAGNPVAALTPAVKSATQPVQTVPKRQVVTPISQNEVIANGVTAKQAVVPVSHQVKPASAQPTVQAPQPAVQKPRPAAPQTAAHEKLPVQEMPSEESLPVVPMAKPVPQQTAEEADTLPIPGPGAGDPIVMETASKYTKDMPVEEILKRMTFEEAKNVVVDTGSCNGWTIEEVSQKRTPSLKFYVYGGYKGENNILRAAAQLMLEHLEVRKAG